MKFAEQLINWRDNNPMVQKCENRIKNQIDAKTSFIITELKAETKKGDIGMYVFDATEFFKTLIDIAQYQYNKTCYASVLELVLANAFSLEQDITVIKDLMNNNCFYIFFNNKAKDETASVRLIKEWFYSYVLKDFENKYKEANNTTARFTSFFEIEYSYLPIIKVLDKLNIPLDQFKPTDAPPISRFVFRDDVIPEELTEMAKENGLSIERTTETEFMLRI